MHSPKSWSDKSDWHCSLTAIRDLEIQDTEEGVADFAVEFSGFSECWVVAVSLYGLGKREEQGKVGIVSGFGL